MDKKITSINNNIDKPEYKVEGVYAGLCTNNPINALKVKYINKTGIICKQHKDDLLQLELVNEISKGKL